VQSRIHETLHGEGHVIGREWAAIGEVNARAELKRDLLAIGRHFPGFGQFGFEFLGVTVDARENASGEIADGERGVVIDKQGIEGLGFSAETEAQLATVLREGSEGEDKGYSKGK
jgi:hypothetical protein